MHHQVNPNSELVNPETLIQLIVFLAGKEEFGVPIDEVREIIKIGTLTPIPDAPEYIKGIINVRGEIVTAIDIKSRFSLPTDVNSFTKHIVVTKYEDSLFGLLVDEVIEVLRISKNDIVPPPEIVKKIHKKYIKGIISHNDRLIILLDVAEVLSQQDFSYSQNEIHKKKFIKNKLHSKEVTKPEASEIKDENVPPRKE